MKRIAQIFKNNDIFRRGAESIKQTAPALSLLDGAIYPRSLYDHDGICYCLARLENQKSLFLVGEKDVFGEFKGKKIKSDGITLLQAELCPENAALLHQVFPFTRPQSLRQKKTTFGCGDRLGRATAGHIHAARQYEVAPVLAQQSIRELTLTNRSYQDVVTDVTFLVFQEGYEKGYGADGDHLKTMADIDTALDAGMPMITLDLSEVMNADAAFWPESKAAAEFQKMDADYRSRLKETYFGKSFPAGDENIVMDEAVVRTCALMYSKAIDFAAQVDAHLRVKRGDQYDFEISIDETTAPTLPSHHLFIIRELRRREIAVNSLAPRFIGEFQKGIDYIGDLDEFERQFKIHCAIAQTNGGYKISVHSGSDKFSAYPAIGRHTGMRLHLKTAGTSWLEAVRTLALHEPGFYRKLHEKAFDCFEAASTLYHITADISRINDLKNMTDEELPEYLNQNESRQLLHITYGGLLSDPDIRDDFFRLLDVHEDAHYASLKHHIGRHMEELGIPHCR